MPLNKPYHTNMEKEISKASNIVNAFFDSSLDADKSIPIEFIQECKGLAFLTVIKAGFIWSGMVGTGIVISRLEDGSWSAPSGIGTAGIGFGAEIGAEIIDFMIVLGSNAAVNAFKKGTQVSVGAGLELAIGPYGRAAAANVNAGGSGISANYTYSHAKGMFAGFGLHGSTLLVRGDLNSRFYGKDVTPMEILSGQVAPPPGSCDFLYEAIRRASNRSGDSMQSASVRYEAGRGRNEIQTQNQNQTQQSNQIMYTPISLSNLPKASLQEVPERGSDPRLSKYNNYKSEKELYAEFSKRKSSKELPQEMKMPQPAESGSETKEIFERVISFVQTQAPHADIALFRENCRLYGQDHLSLNGYYAYLNSVFGLKLLPKLVPDLVRLLPSHEKRKELWERYTNQTVRYTNTNTP